MWPSWKKSLPAPENSVYLLTYPLPASSKQRDPRLNPCSPAGDGGRLGRARWEGRAGYVLLISGETAPRRNAKLLQRLIRVKGFLSVMAPRRCAPSEHLPSERLTFQCGREEKGETRFFGRSREWQSQGWRTSKTGMGRNSLSALGESHCKTRRS